MNSRRKIFGRGNNGHRLYRFTQMIVRSVDGGVRAFGFRWGGGVLAADYSDLRGWGEGILMGCFLEGLYEF